MDEGSARKLGLAGARRVTGERVSTHRMATIDTETGAVLAEFNATSPHPWRTKGRNRAASKRARASRKANR